MAGDPASAGVGPHRVGGYCAWPAAGELRPWVETTWIHTTPPRLVLPAGAGHLVVPHPGLSLSFTCFREEAGGLSEPRLVLIGPVLHPRAFSFHPGFEMASVALKPEWAPALLGAHPGEHLDGIEDLSGIDPGLADPLLDRLSRTRTALEAVAVLAAAVRRRAEASPRRCPSRRAGRALELLRASRGRVSVEGLAQSLDVSSRHLRREVRDALGLSPKTVARLLRFERVVLAADRLEQPDWAALAADAGYFDQAHLIAEFRSLAGTSPGRLLAERRAETGEGSAGSPRA